VPVAPLGKRGASPELVPVVGCYRTLRHRSAPGTTLSIACSIGGAGSAKRKPKHLQRVLVVAGGVGLSAAAHANTPASYGLVERLIGVNRLTALARGDSERFEAPERPRRQGSGGAALRLT